MIFSLPSVAMTVRFSFETINSIMQDGSPRLGKDHELLVIEKSFSLYLFSR